MLFNNQVKVDKHLGTCYLAGDIVFADDDLYTPVNNTVKRIQIPLNTTSLIPFENLHQTKLLNVSPNQVLLIAIDIAGHAVVFNLKGNFIVAEFNFKGVVTLAQFSKDGKLFAIAQEKGFSVYECPPYSRTFEPFVLLKKYKTRHSGDITAMTFSPDSRFLATCGADSLIYINNLFPLPDYMAFTLEVHRFKILSVHYSHEMNFIYSTDSGGNLFVWRWVDDVLTQGYLNLQAAKKRKLSNLKSKRVSNEEAKPEERQGHLSDFEQRVLEGRYILAKKLIVSEAGGYLKKVYFNASTGFLATAYSHGKFSIFRLQDEQLTPIQSFTVGENKISALTVNASCTWIGLGLKSLGQLIIWEWKSQSYIMNQRGFVHETKTIAYNGVKLYASGTDQGVVKLFEAKSALCVHSFEEHEAAITDLKFSRGDTLFSSSLDGSVNAYDVVKWKKFRSFKPDHPCQLTCLETDPQGEIVLAGAFDPYEIYSWSVQTGNLLQVIGGHEAPIASIALAAQQLVTGSWDRQLKIHQIFARKLNVETLDHGSQITAITVHPNLKEVAVATIKGEIYMWEVQSGSMMGIIQGELSGGRSYFSKVTAENDPSNKYLRTLAYSNCGNYLYGGGKSKYLMVYDVKHRMVLAKIVLTANRDLQGVHQKLNSRYIENGISTYELVLQAQEYGHSDDEQEGKLPGAKKMDVSELRIKLEVEVRKIVVKSSTELAVATSFGVLLLSTLTHKHAFFNPYELTLELTPAVIPGLIAKQEYAAAVTVCLQLNMGLRKLLKKIKKEHIKVTVSELGEEKWGMFLEKISESALTFREVLWVEAILSEGGKAPRSLRSALEPIEEQVRLLRQTTTLLQMSQLQV